MSVQDQIVYPVGFAAGTSVHTQHGQIPIEHVRAGTRVLAQPELEGGLDYRSILNVVAYEAQPLWVVRVLVVGEEFLTTIVATDNQLFWVGDGSAHETHWVRAKNLEPGFNIQLVNGERCLVHMAGMVRYTLHQGYGYAADDRVVMGTRGVVLDLRGEKIAPAQGDDSVLISKEREAGTLQFREPYLATAYSLIVDEFRTCYVGETGVWVAA